MTGQKMIIKSRKKLKYKQRSYQLYPGDCSGALDIKKCISLKPVFYILLQIVDLGRYILSKMESSILLQFLLFLQNTKIESSKHPLVAVMHSKENISVINF